MNSYVSEGSLYVLSDAVKVMISERKIAPKLVAFLANDDPAAKQYADWSAKTSRDAGIEFELRQVPRTELEERVMEANQDDGVNGIMVYYPVFGDPQDQYIQSVVDKRKDVEGLCHTFKFNMYHNIRYLDKEQQKFKCIIPCTPLAIVKVLEHLSVYNNVLAEGNRLHGKTITIINRSEIVGRPLAALLANDGARVFSVDVNGLLEFHRGQGLKLRRHEVVECAKTLEDVLPISDVVITGVPSAKYKIKSSLMKDGVVAINFSSANNFEEDIKTKASLYVPSVGKVTVSMLERNLLRLYEYQKSGDPQFR
jgi:methylenetetrahydrofolate dehydrogenase (NAD+)